MSEVVGIVQLLVLFALLDACRWCEELYNFWVLD